MFEGTCDTYLFKASWWRWRDTYVLFIGHSHYGCLVNKTKSITNFETEICGHKMGDGMVVEEPIGEHYQHDVWYILEN